MTEGKYFKRLDDRFQISKQIVKDVNVYTLWESKGFKWVAIHYGSYDECKNLYVKMKRG